MNRKKEKNYPDWDNSLKFSANNSWFEAGQTIEMVRDKFLVTSLGTG